VFVPTPDPGSFAWSKPEACLWDAPSYMQSKVPLMARYSSTPNKSFPARFFQEILQIKNVTWKELIEELKFLRTLRDRVYFENVKDIYILLNSMRLANHGISAEIK
jgi:hypothetical protein